MPDLIDVIDEHLETKLSRMEFKLFTYFLDNQGELVTYTKIAFALWGETDDYYGRNMSRELIFRLRKKIGAERIVTVRGRGYIYL